jgi:hypothetical protein
MAMKISIGFQNKPMNPKNWGQSGVLRIGILSVLHTWGSALTHHHRNVDSSVG